MQPIIWDWDGTLVESHETIRQAYNAAFRAFGMPEWSIQEAKKLVSLSGRDSFPRWFGANAAVASDIFYETYSRLAPSTVKAKAGREKLLQTFAHVPMAIVSNKRGDILRAEVAALGWGKYFQALIGAGDAVRDKPDTAPYAMLLGCTSWAQGQGVYVGDSPVDAAFAQNCGLDAVLLVDETHPQAELQATGAEVMAFADLPVYLRHLG